MSQRDDATNWFTFTIVGIVDGCNQLALVMKLMNDEELEED